MPNVPNASCSSCGKPAWRTKTSRPEITCRECRRERPSAQRKRKQPITRTCKQCGKGFQPWKRAKSQPPQAFCSRSCAATAQNVARGGISRLRSCEVCGKQFTATRTDKPQRACSRTCGIELRRRDGTLGVKPGTKGPHSRVYIRNCAHCGKVFVGRRSDIRFCGKACYDRAYNAQRSGRRWLPGQRQCASCDALVSDGRWKCDACLAVAKKLQRQRKRRAERARHRGLAREPYTLEEIAARDRYQCGLCRKRVAMTKAVPHPRSPTIDHVLPIACGGDDTRANVQLAHFECNSRKCTGGSQQLALIG